MFLQFEQVKAGWDTRVKSWFMKQSKPFLSIGNHEKAIMIYDRRSKSETEGELKPAKVLDNVHSEHDKYL